MLESACERGFSVYGVSEHAPRLRAEDLYPGEEDLTPADLARIFSAYVDRARALQGELEGRLEVLVGFETEMVPPEGWLDWMNELRSAHFDYTIGSVHHVRDMPIDMTEERNRQAAAHLGGMSALHRAYFQQLAEMVSEFRPTVVGHFDLIRKFAGENPSFDESTWLEIERALEAVRESGALLDVNAAPPRRGLGPPYPLAAILERARQMEIGVTLGDDSHGPAEVGIGLDACLKAISAAGYQQVHCLRRREGATATDPIPLEEVAPS